MKKNVLIVGCGKMGLSHLKSFLKKNFFTIYIIDKNNKKLKKIFNGNNKIIFIKELSKLPNLDFCIVSTDSKPRYEILKKIIKKIRVETFLIEKFIFNKKYQYNNFKKKFKTDNIYVNVWGKFFYNKIKKKLLLFNNLQINIQIQEKILLTNLIHLINFLSYFSNFKFLKSNNLKLIKSNSKGYDEILGEIQSSYKNNKLSIKTNRQKNIFSININDIRNQKNLKIILDKKLNILFFYNKKIFSKIRFPLASKYTYQIFKNNNLVPTYNEVSRDSLKILRFTEKYFKKPLSIR